MILRVPVRKDQKKGWVGLISTAPREIDANEQAANGDEKRMKGTGRATFGFLAQSYRRTTFNVQFGLTVYKYLNDTYVSQHKEVAALRAWTRPSVEREYAVNAVDLAESISQAYNNLKKAAGGTTADIHRDLKRQYHKLIKPWKKVPKDLVRWTRTRYGSDSKRACHSVFIRDFWGLRFPFCSATLHKRTRNRSWILGGHYE